MYPKMLILIFIHLMLGATEMLDCQHDAVVTDGGKVYDTTDADIEVCNIRCYCADTDGMM